METGCQYKGIGPVGSADVLAGIVFDQFCRVGTYLVPTLQGGYRVGTEACQPYLAELGRICELEITIWDFKLRRYADRW